MGCTTRGGSARWRRPRKIDDRDTSANSAGTHGIERARKLDNLSIRDEAVIDSLSETFEPQQVYLGEFF